MGAAARAVQKNDVRELTWILDQGQIDFDHEQHIHKPHDEFHGTILLFAILCYQFYHDLRCIELLIERGADPNGDPVEMAKFFASEKGPGFGPQFEAVVKVLEQNGAQTE